MRSNMHISQLYRLHKIICPRPHEVRALSVDGHRLSVRLSVPCLTLSPERKGISWNLARVTRDPFRGGKFKIAVTQFRGRKVKGQGHQAD